MDKAEIGNEVGKTQKPQEMGEPCSVYLFYFSLVYLVDFICVSSRGQEYLTYTTVASIRAVGNLELHGGNPRLSVGCLQFFPRKTRHRHSGGRTWTLGL